MSFDPTKHLRRSIRLQGDDYTRSGAYFVTIVTQGRVCLFGEVVDGEMRLNEAGRIVLSVWETMPQRFPFIMLDAFVIMPNHIHAIIVITDDMPANGATTMGATTRVAPIQPNDADDATVNGATTMGATTRVAPTPQNGADNTPVGAGLVPAQTPPAQIPPDQISSDQTPPIQIPPDQTPPDQTYPNTVPHSKPSLGEIIGAFKSLTTTAYIRAVLQSNLQPFERRLWQRNYYEHIIRNDVSMDSIRQYIIENPMHWATDPENPVTEAIHPK